MALHQRHDPPHVLVAPLRVRKREVLAETGLLGRRGVLEKMDQHQRALALDDVAGEVLPVDVAVARHVQDVVLNLERRAQEIAELDEPVGLERLPGADQRARTARENRGVPAGLLGDHPQVVGRVQVVDVVLAPAELPRLALDGLEHGLERLFEYLQGQQRPERGRVVEQRLEAEQSQRVAGVHRQRHACLLVKARRAAPQVADVLDVVVHEHRVVHQLDCRRSVERLFGAGAERPGAGNQQAGAQHAARAFGVRRDEIVEVLSRLLVGQVFVQALARERPVLGHLAPDQAGLYVDPGCGHQPFDSDGRLRSFDAHPSAIVSTAACGRVRIDMVRARRCRRARADSSRRPRARGSAAWRSAARSWTPGSSPSYTPTFCPLGIIPTSTVSAESSSSYRSGRLRVRS